MQKFGKNSSILDQVRGGFFATAMNPAKTLVQRLIPSTMWKFNNLKRTSKVVDGDQKKDFILCVIRPSLNSI